MRGRLLGLALMMLAVWPAACRSGGSSGNGGGDAGSAPAQVAETAAASVQPAGGGLLLVRGQRLLLRDMSGGAERAVLTASGSAFYTYPRWSPDGRQIAYVVKTNPTGRPNETWGSNVLTSAADGSGERTVFRQEKNGTSVEGIDWAADGTALYLGLLEPEMVANRDVTSRITLQRLDLATGARTMLAANAAYPAVSPDGGAIAYLVFSGGARQAGLWTARPDGSDPQLLIPIGPGQRFAGLRWPRYAPDGRRIAFGGVLREAAELSPPPCGSGKRRWWQPRTASAHGPPIDLWAIPAAGGEPELLAELRADDPYLAWSPDGATIAVLATCALSQVEPGGAVRRIGDGAALSQIDWR